MSQRLLFDALVFLTTVNKEPIDVKKLAKAVGLPDDELEAMIDAPRLAVPDAANDDKAREEYEAHVTRELGVLMGDQMLNYNFESVYDCVRKLAAGEQAGGEEGGDGEENSGSASWMADINNSVLTVKCDCLST